MTRKNRNKIIQNKKVC